MAQSPRLTPELRDALLGFLRAGLPIDTAARVIGVTDSTVRVWRSRAVAHRRGYARFEDEVQQALAEGEALLVSRVADAGRGNWRAAAWLLERLYPDRYGPPNPLDIPDAPAGNPADELAGL